MKQTADIQIRDPYIVKAHGKYYLFGSTDENIWGVGTANSFEAYVGKDLEHWEGPFTAFKPDDQYFGKDNFWAPEVHAYEGAYYMLATFRGADKKRGTAILKSDDPLGPYEPHSEGPVTPKDWMSLDGTLYVDEAGQPYMVFCHEWVQIKIGEICAIPLSKDLKKAIGEPVTLLKASDANYSREVHSNEHQMTGLVTDGPFYLRLEDGQLALLWSTMGENGYAIGYAISKSGHVLGPYEQCQMPIYEADGGHGMVFRAYDSRLLLSIHTPNDTPNERASFFELVVQEGQITVKP